MNERLFFDWNATTPPLPEVIDAMAAAQRDAWANPSSVHAEGRVARARLERARQSVASLVGARPYDVIFTSGGTEASNLAMMAPFSDGGGALVLSDLEHASVLACASELAARGVEVRKARVRSNGSIDVGHVAELLALGKVRLVALQAANGETGVRQPFAQVAELARARGAVFHLDAIQAVGRVVAPEGGWLAHADTIALAAHKIRGPKGIGALVTQPGHPLRPLLLGGGQERGLRPGTQDAALAAGFAVAADAAGSSPATYALLEPLRDELQERLCAVPAVAVNGSAPRVPHVLHVSVRGWDSASLVAALDLEGVAVSGGPACAAGHPEPSSTMRAMWNDQPDQHWRYDAPLRWSLPSWTTKQHIAEAAERFLRVLSRRA